MTMRRRHRASRRQSDLAPTAKVTRAAAADGRLLARTLEAVTHEKAEFIAWLNSHGHTPEKSAELLAQLKACPDPRVQMRALELETKIRGFFEDQPQRGGVNIQINIGVPTVRQPPPREVPAAAPATEPKP